MVAEKTNYKVSLDLDLLLGNAEESPDIVVRDISVQTTQRIRSKYVNVEADVGEEAE